MKKFFVIMTAAFLVVPGCSTTYITSSWKSPEGAPAQFKKLMVLGIVREADRRIRENMERHMVDDLRALGYQAFSSYVEYGPKEFSGLSEEEARAKLQRTGVDGVITIVLLDKERERHYVPGRVVYSPYAYYHNRFWGYYRTIYSRVETAGYYEVSTRYFWESNFYDMTTNRLLYSVQTQSFEPASAESLGHEYGKKIIEDMVRKGILTSLASKGKDVAAMEP
ncbi:MAG TPA: hypothetical protein VFZ78_12360 [Flavisolibacter sp.]